MTAQQVSEEVQRRVSPIMHELGFDGYVLAGYLKTEVDGKEQYSRQVIGDGGNNPVIEDGLRPVLAGCVRWATGQQ